MMSRPLLIATLMNASLLLATPAIAADAVPNSAMRILAPPPAGYDSPTPRGLGHDAWVIECRRRLDSVNGANPALSPDACQAWWAYFQAGGQPNPVYGYVIPVMLTETAPNCRDEAVVKTTIETTIRRHTPRRRLYPDKRIPN